MQIKWFPRLTILNKSPRPKPGNNLKDIVVIKYVFKSKERTNIADFPIIDKIIIFLT